MAAPKNHLRATKPGEKAPDAPPKTLTEAVGRTERDVLVTLRAKLAAELDAGVPAAYLAPVMRQLREVDKELRAFDKRAEQEAKEDAEGFSSSEEWDEEAL